MMKTTTCLYITVLLFFLFNSQPALAIMNIETLRAQKNVGFQGGVNLNFLGEKGNSDKFTSNLRTLNAYIKDRHEVLLLTNYTYGESIKIKDSHKGSAHARYTYKLSKYFYSEFFTQVEFDEFRHLDFRQITGTGLRTPLTISPNYTVAFGYGAFYEYEVYNTSPNEERVRANFYVSYYQDVNPQVSFSSTLYLQPDVENTDDLRAIFSPILKTKISERLSLVTIVNLRYDNRPVPETKEYDLSYNFGFNYDFQ